MNHFNCDFFYAIGNEFRASGERSPAAFRQAVIKHSSAHHVANATFKSHPSFMDHYYRHLSYHVEGWLEANPGLSPAEILAMLTPLVYESIYPLEVLSRMPLQWMDSQISKNHEYFKRYHDDCMMGGRKFWPLIPKLSTLSSHPELTWDFVAKYPTMEVGPYDTAYAWDASVLAERFLTDDAAGLKLFEQNIKLLRSPVLAKFSWFTEELIAKHFKQLIAILYVRSAYYSHYDPIITPWDQWGRISLSMVDKIVAFAGLDQEFATTPRELERWRVQLRGVDMKKLSLHPELTIAYVHAHPGADWNFEALAQRWPDRSAWFTPQFIADHLARDVYELEYWQKQGLLDGLTPEDCRLVVEGLRRYLKKFLIEGEIDSSYYYTEVSPYLIPGLEDLKLFHKAVGQACDPQTKTADFPYNKLKELHPRNYNWFYDRQATICK